MTNAARFGSLTRVNLLTIHDGKIQQDRLTFDSHKVRQSQSS